MLLFVGHHMAAEAAKPVMVSQEGERVACVGVWSGEAACRFAIEHCTGDARGCVLHRFRYNVARSFDFAQDDSGGDLAMIGEGLDSGSMNA
jgi:hypothetical protein